MSLPHVCGKGHAVSEQLTKRRFLPSLSVCVCVRRLVCEFLSSGEAVGCLSEAEECIHAEMTNWEIKCTTSFDATASLCMNNHRFMPQIQCLATLILYWIINISTQAFFLFSFDLKGLLHPYPPPPPYAPLIWRLPQDWRQRSIKASFAKPTWQQSQGVVIWVDMQINISNLQLLVGGARGQHRWWGGDTVNDVNHKKSSESSALAKCSLHPPFTVAEKTKPKNRKRTLILKRKSLEIRKMICPCRKSFSLNF